MLHIRTNGRVRDFSNSSTFGYEVYNGFVSLIKIEQENNYDIKRSIYFVTLLYLFFSDYYTEHITKECNLPSSF